MSLRNGTAPAGLTVCGSNDIMAQTCWTIADTFNLATVMTGFAINITFPGTPPYRLTASPQRGNTTICPSHVQNLTSNTFTWIVATSTNATALRTITGTSPERSPGPIFQLGDGVQWIAHEWTPQSNGQIRYFSSINYTVTSEERSLAEQTAKARSGGLRVAEAGVMGWLVGMLLLSGAMITSL